VTRPMTTGPAPRHVCARRSLTACWFLICE
jgi:hypothetical protein